MQLLNNQTKSASQHSLKSERMKWSCNRRKCTLRSSDRRVHSCADRSMKTLGPAIKPEVTLGALLTFYLRMIIKGRSIPLPHRSNLLRACCNKVRHAQKTGRYFLSALDPAL